MFKSIVTSYRVQSMFYLLFFPIFVMVAPFTGGAEEMEWLVPPAFEGEELAKVREWEKYFFRIRDYVMKMDVS